MNLNNKPKLKIYTLSGTESVTKNMTLYECGDDMIIVDCGVGFPDSDMLGVDMVLPDMSYVMENKHRVRGLFITHGHEDHLGAVPFLLQQLNIPIYCGKLVEGFIRERLKDKRYKNLLETTSFRPLSPDTGEAVAGCFTVSAFRVNHSVPSSMGFAIKTPQGVVLHMADYKIDWTPVLDKPIDLPKIASYTGVGDGVLCLLSDCLGVTSEGYSKSESTLNDTFEELFDSAGDRQIFVTTISSNISRMHQIITAARRHGRKVVLCGRSINQSVSVARSLGYLAFDDSMFIDEDAAMKYLQKDLVYIIAGCYGQQGSALDRLSRGEHEHLEVEENAIVVFSADPNPPGVAEAVEKVMDALTLKGVEVIYSKIQDNLHVSGHGTKGDLMTIASIVKPKYFIPIGGTVTKMRAYTNMVGELGFKKENVFELLEGECVEFMDGKASSGERIEVKQVLIDGSGSESLSPVVVKDREILSSDGVFVVIVASSTVDQRVNYKVEVVTRGFVYVKESRALIGRSRDLVNKILDKSIDGSAEWNAVRTRIENDVERFLWKETGRHPLVIVHNINIG